MSLKRSLRSLAEEKGFQLHKTTVYNSKNLRQRRLFSLLEIDLIIDVGANTGHFAHLCRDIGYKGEIISFEPGAAAHASLLLAAADDPLWTVADRMALGDTTGAAEINISANSFSSSLLPMLPSHLSAAPESRYLHREKVPMRRLDSVLETIAPNRRIFLKLDVQGFEPQVLHGASQILPFTRAVQLEMSLLPLYQGEVLMADMCAVMSAKGFEIWDLESSFRDLRTGRLLQVDGVFTRPAARSKS
jgi:FkbM family methyltransferase